MENINYAISGQRQMKELTLPSSIRTNFISTKIFMKRIRL